MSSPIRIVTDSAAQFIDPSVIERYHITVLPLEVHIDSHVYREGVDLAPGDFRAMSAAATLPVLAAPRLDDLQATYATLFKETDKILSIHLSRAMHNTWSYARQAAESLLGRCDIAVVDSASIAVGQGLLVETAARLAAETDVLDDVLRELRKLVPHIYSIFCVEHLNYLRRSSLLLESQALVGEMLGIRPFLTIEEGELLAMEKARSRPQMVDKLVEFVTEFAAIERIAILHGTGAPEGDAQTLAERLRQEFVDQDYPLLVYQPSLATFIGPNALGVMLFERDLSDSEDTYQDDSSEYEPLG